MTDLCLADAKEAAVAQSAKADSSRDRTVNNHVRGAQGNDSEEPSNREEGLELWQSLMSQRFVNGEDTDFEYHEVDDSDEYDDLAELSRAEEDQYYHQEQPSFTKEEPSGETGIQDF